MSGEWERIGDVVRPRVRTTSVEGGEGAQGEGAQGAGCKGSAAANVGSAAVARCQQISIAAVARRGPLATGGGMRGEEPPV